MSVLNDKLEKIIADSGIYFYKDEIDNELKIADKIIDIHEAAQKMWCALPCDANIAIYGLGQDSKYLFESVDLTKKNVVCMIDNNPDINIFIGYPVIRNEDIPANNIDIVITTSRVYSDEMKSAVEMVLPDCKIINMWDETFYEKKFRLFYDRGLWRKMSLNSAVLKYNKNHDFRYLLYSINSYLELRDLKNALAYIDKYLYSDYSHADKMLGLKNNLLDLLSKIKQKLETKQNSNTLALIADAMRAKDINPENTPFLYALGKSNIYCPNAYTHMTWTSTSILSIFKQKNYIDNHLYKDVRLVGTEPFFEYILKNNIDFVYYSAVSKETVFENISEFFQYNPNGCANIIWQYLCSAFENDKKTICFLHFSETHLPNICLRHTNGFSFLDNTYLDCLKYIDSQAEFLFTLLPNSTKLLFCSDHGNNMDVIKGAAKVIYSNNRCNIPYVICDRKTHSGTDTRLVSHLDTLDILINLANGELAFKNINHRTLVEINEEFLYSQAEWNNFLNADNNHEKHRACKCFISDKDKYVIFYDGEERYFLLTDDRANLIDDERYADRINWFRENVNTEFPDWSDDNGRYDITRKYLEID